MTKNKKEQVLVPELRFPEFRDDGKWEEKSVSETCRVTQGGTPDTSVPGYWNGTVQWITPAEMGKDENPYIAETVRTITEEGLRNCSSELLPDSSIILSTRAPIGHLAINKSPMAINQGCRGLIPLPGINTRFIYYSLRRSKGALNDLGSGNTFKELSGKILKNFKIAIPHLSEQQKIADCLGSLDDLIAAHSRKLDALQDHKKGLLQQLFPAEGQTTPNLRFPGFEGEWENRTLGELGKIVTGKTPSTKENRLWNGDVLFITPTDISETRKYQRDTQRRVVETPKIKVLPEGSIVYTCIASIGKMAITVKPSVTNQQINSVIVYERLWSEFVYYALANKTPWIKSIPASSTLAIINKTEFTQIVLAIPKKKAEQKKIADCLSALDALITAQTEQIAALKEHKKGLMQNLFPEGKESEKLEMRSKKSTDPAQSAVNSSNVLTSNF